MDTANRDLLRHNVLRNALYHTARRLTYEWRVKALNLVVVLLGAAAMGDVLGHFDCPQFVTGALIATAGAIQLVFDFAGAAQDHQRLGREYYGLLAEIEATPTDALKEALAPFWSRMTTLTGEERPTMRAVDAIAHNNAIDALDVYPRGERLHICWWQRLTADWLAYNGHSYETLSEREGGRGGGLEGGGGHDAPSGTGAVV